MKNILIATILLFSCHNLVAQKYITRTGKVSFFSSTPVENILAINNEAAAIIDGSKGDVVFQIPIKSFKFEKALMQEHFNENYMESNKYPKAEFKGKIEDVSTVNFDRNGSYDVVAKGKMTIHGVTREVTIPGTIVVKGKQITANSKFRVRPADFNISIPNLVEGKIAKQIEVTINSELLRK